MDSTRFSGTSRYEVRRCLGGGEGGLVYEALDHRRGSLVALKALPDLTADGLVGLKQEFRSIADLSHPCLVALYELVGGDEGWFIAMEHVRGVGFHEYVRGPGRPAEEASTREVAPLPESVPTQPDVTDPKVRRDVGTCPANLLRLREALAQLLSGVGALHAAGNLHRDLKPSNVRVTESGRLVVLDYGLMYDMDRTRSELTGAATLSGHLSYLAPEQILGGDMTPASDLYAVGVMLFEALTGQSPHEGSLIQALELRTGTPAPRPSERSEGVPADLDALCADLMALDPDSRPTAADALRQLGALRSQDRWRLRITPGGQPLWGRKREQDGLAAAWRVSRSGRMVVVSLDGEAGLGRTALLDAFRASVEDSGQGLVLRGRCFEREQVPYKALDNWMDGMCRWLRRQTEEFRAEVMPADAHFLARLFPVFRELVLESEPTDREAVRAVDPAELRRRAVEAFSSLMNGISRKQPLVVILDDLHWGDTDSARIVTGWLDTLSRSRVLVVLSWRSDQEDLSPFLQHVRSAPRWARADVRALHLAPLDAEACRRVLQTVAGLDDKSSTGPLEHLIAASEGRPQRLVEYAEALRRGEANALDDAGTGSASWMTRRRDEVSKNSGRVLDALAISERRVTARVVARAAGLDLAETERAIAELRDRGWVRTHAGTVGLWVALYDANDAQRLAQDWTALDHVRRHRAMAEAMAAEHFQDPEARMVHHLGGGQRAIAAQWAATAARKSVDLLAFEHAASLYETALQLGDWEAIERLELRMERVSCLVHAGCGVDAGELLMSLAEDASVIESRRLRLRAAQQFLSSGHFERGLRELSALMEELQMAPPVQGPMLAADLLMGRARIWWGGLDFEPRSAESLDPARLQRIDICWSASLALNLLDPPRGAWFHQTNLMASLRAGEPTRVLRAYSLELILRSSRQGTDREDWNRLLSRARELANQIHRPEMHALVQLAEGLSNYLTGNLHTALRLLRQAERVFVERCVDVSFELNLARLFALRSQLYMGQLRKVGGVYKDVMRRAEEQGDRLLMGHLRSDAFVLLDLAAGRPEEADRTLERANADLVGVEGAYQLGFYMRGRIHRLLYEARYDEAYDYLQRSWPRVYGAQRHRTMLARVLLMESRAFASLGGGAAGMRTATSLVRQLRSLSHRAATPLAHLVMGAIHRRQGEDSQAAKQFALAERGFDRMEMQVYSAVARRRRGQSLGGEEGAAWVRSADGWLENEGVVDVERFADAICPDLLMRSR